MWQEILNVKSYRNFYNWRVIISPQRGCSRERVVKACFCPSAGAVAILSFCLFVFLSFCLFVFFCLFVTDQACFFPSAGAVAILSDQLTNLVIASLESIPANQEVLWKYKYKYKRQELLRSSSDFFSNLFTRTDRIAYSSRWIQVKKRNLRVREHLM